MNKVLTRGIITIAAVNDGKDGHSLTAKAFIEGSYRNGRTKGVKSYVKVFYDGQKVKDFTVSYRYKGAGQADWVKPQTNKEDSWSDAQRDGSTIFVEYVVEYKGLTAVATGRLDNIQDGKKGSDAVSYKLIPMVENVLAYFAEVDENNSENTENKKKKEKMVDVRLVYKIMKSVGEQVNFITNLIDEGMTLTIKPSVEEAFRNFNGVYGLSKSVGYAEIPNNSYVVTLKKGSDIVDQRIVPITMKPKVVFDIDTVNGSLTSQIEAVNGKMTKIEQNAEHISLTVDGGIRPNLLWGSDLDLSEVQDVIKKAYKLGNSIKDETEKKAEWKRKRDQAGSDDDRMRYQEGMDACDREVAQAQGEVVKCREAIGKHLGIVISGDMEIGNNEMFEYLKGEGVGGSDAIRFKNAYKREDWAKWTNISWRDVPLKQNTTYTISVWVKFKSYGKKGRMYIDCASDDGRYCFGGYLYKENYYSRESIDEWKRVRYVFNSGASKKMSCLNFCCIADEEEGAQCEIWLCHPKLEEGNTATPWCAYDGTVEALLASGLDIKDRKFTATADNFVVKNNKGERTFMVDEKGALRSIDTSGKGCIVLRPEVGYISILDSETGKERVMVSNNGIFCLGVKDNNIVFDTGDERGMYAGLDMGAGMFRVNAFNDEAIGMQLDIIMNGLPYTGNNNLQYSQLYVDGKNNLKINTGEPIVKFLHPNDGYTMKSTDTTIVADTEPYRDAKITLPKNPQVGMEVEIINIGTGFCYLETADNTKIFWDEVKTKETVREHRKISLLYVGGSDDLWIYTTEGYCGNHT